jgi:hypothetical protein
MMVIYVRNERGGNFVITLTALEREEAMTKTETKHDLRESLPGHGGAVPASDLVEDREGNLAARPDLKTDKNNILTPDSDRKVPLGQTTSG